MMRLSQKKIKLIGVSIVWLSLFISGCLGWNRVLLEGDRAWPRNPEFSVTPKEYHEEDLNGHGLRTDGVYALIGFRPPEAERPGFKGSAYWRFWPNGRMLYRAAQLPTNGIELAVIADSFERGYPGFYEFDQDGYLVTESFDRESGHWRKYSYNRIKIKIEDETLWVQRGAIGKHRLAEIGYRFVKIDGMSAEPDW